MVKSTLLKNGFQFFDTGNSAGAMAVAEERSIDVLVPHFPIVFTSGYPVCPYGAGFQPVDSLSAGPSQPARA